MSNQNKQLRPHADLIKAWADGATIQIYDKDEDKWSDCCGLPASFLGGEDKPTIQYRIKPKQKNAPKRNDGYFYVDDGGVVRCTIWNDSNQDFFRLDVGNVYYAQSVANRVAERVRAALKGKEPEGEKDLAQLNLSEGEAALIRAIRKTGVLCTWKRKSATLVFEAAGELVSRNDVVAFFTDGAYADDDEIRAALDAISREQEAKQEADND